MRRNPGLFRLTATVALAALLGDTLLPLAAVAQQPPPPPLPAGTSAQPNQNQADPPARVGRVAGITGALSFHNQGDTQWSTCSVNYPVSAGNAFWTEPTAQARLEISDSRIALAGATEFDVYSLDAAGLQGVAMQGEAYFRLRDLAPNEVWSVQTPRGLVRLGGEGRYEILVGSTDQPTLVTVIEGSAQIEGPGVSLQVNGEQTATISGLDSFQGSVGPALRDAFLSERLNAERPPPAPAGIPAQVTAMPGGSDLYGVGTWSQAPQYGQVWYPPVDPGWVPYRHGHWAYVAPWGWTWIDDAPWGFAPFHYGRWLQVDSRWAWTPGEAAVAGPPVYAPALVAFIGIGAGVALGAALASGSIGWVPLGPREPFRPWYHSSPNYVREVNINHVSNVTNNNVTINNFVNRGGATSVPAAAMLGSRPVQSAAQPLTPQALAAAHPIVGQQPLRPSAATSGVTPAVARQLNLTPAPMARSAPGPAVRTLTQGPGGGGFARPTFAPAGRPPPNNPAIRPATTAAPNVTEPARPGAIPMARPGEPNLGHPEPARPEHGRPTPATPRPEREAAPRPEPRVVTPQVAAPHPVARPAEPPRPEAVTRPAAPYPEPRVVTPSAPRPAEPMRMEPMRTEPMRTEPMRTEPARPVAQPRPEARPEPARREEPAREKKPGER